MIDDHSRRIHIFRSLYMLACTVCNRDKIELDNCNLSQRLTETKLCVDDQETESGMLFYCRIQIDLNWIID